MCLKAAAFSNLQKQFKTKKVMTKKQFNRDYFVRVRILEPEIYSRLRMSKRERNFLMSYDKLRFFLGERFDCVLTKVERACACKFVVRPFHGVEFTFIAH